MGHKRAIAIAALLAGCALLPPGVSATLGPDTPVMTNAEIKTTLVGHTMAGTVIGSGPTRGLAWTQTETPDGRLTWSDSAGHRDTGTRTIRGDASCAQWPSFAPGEVRCYKIVRHGDSFVSYRPDGTVSSLAHNAHPAPPDIR